MKGQEIKLTVTAVTPEGFGVGRDENGKVVFVGDTAVGDHVRAQVIKELKNSSIARLNAVEEPSPDRIEPDCAVCRRCGGCVFRHIDYGAELRIKRGFVADALSRIGGLNVEVGDVLHGDPLRCRNKVQYPFARSDDGRCVFGYYARRSHRIVTHDFCPLQSDDFHKVADYCAKRADLLGIRAYDETAKDGVLRHIVMRRNNVGEMLVCLVASENSEKLTALCDDIYSAFDFVIGVHINFNSRPDNVIFGDRTVCAVGRGDIQISLCGRVFEVSSRSFFQVNTDMAERLYNYAKGLVGSGGGETLLDLYCGVGSVGLCIAGENDRLCGVEIVDSAVENAKKNAVLNGRSAENTLFVRGDAAIGVSECEKRFGRPDVIIVDPPRKGLDGGVIKTAVQAKPKKIIYISCDPATLARDCAIFAENGYSAHFAQPFDLFPRTGHVETACLLSRSEINS